MSQPQRQPYVFVVDDEEVIASTLTTILQLHGGFRARSFTKPIEALEAARLEAPDLLISDVVMPQLSGIDLAIQVRESCPNCKVLLFSDKPRPPIYWMPPVPTAITSNSSSSPSTQPTCSYGSRA